LWVVVFARARLAVAPLFQKPHSLFDYLTDLAASRRVTFMGRIHHGFMDAIDLEDPETAESLFTEIVKFLKLVKARDQHERYLRGARSQCGYSLALIPFLHHFPVWDRRLFLIGHSLGGECLHDISPSVRRFPPP
jgi:hypothetical protein